MRELILKMTLSFDGFASALDGDNGWMFGTDEAARAWSAGFLAGAGLHIMGSRSFLDMAAFWPGATGPFAGPMNAIPKVVFSRQGPAILQRLAPAPATARGPAAESWSSADVARGALVDEVARLKARPGKPDVAHGGVRFARSLVAAGLVDSFVLLVAHVALGKGLPLFGELTTPQRLRLMDSQAFPCGAVAQTYRPA